MLACIGTSRCKQGHLLEPHPRTHASSLLPPRLRSSTRTHTPMHAARPPVPPVPLVLQGVPGAAALHCAGAEQLVPGCRQGPALHRRRRRARPPRLPDRAGGAAGGHAAADRAAAAAHGRGRVAGAALRAPAAVGCAVRAGPTGWARIRLFSQRPSPAAFLSFLPPLTFFTLSPSLRRPCCAAVFQAGWASVPAEWRQLPEGEAAAWRWVLGIRSEINLLLERARADKALGASLEAKVGRIRGGSGRGGVGGA